MSARGMNLDGQTDIERYLSRNHSTDLEDKTVTARLNGDIVEANYDDDLDNNAVAKFEDASPGEVQAILDGSEYKTEVRPDGIYAVESSEYKSNSI